MKILFLDLSQQCRKTAKLRNQPALSLHSLTLLILHLILITYSSLKQRLVFSHDRQLVVLLKVISKSNFLLLLLHVKSRKGIQIESYLFNSISTVVIGSHHSPTHRKSLLYILRTKITQLLKSI